MARVITFSRAFPAYHPKKGQPTYFVEKFWESYESNEPDISKVLSPLISYIQDYKSSNDFSYTKYGAKNHTIRAGNRWKEGDYFSPRVWSGKPYNSPMIIIAPDTLITSVWNFQITTENDDGENDWSFVEFLGKKYTCYGYGGYDDNLMVNIAKNDGLSIDDLYAWFLTVRTNKQKLNNEPKIFKGQIICWNKSVNY